MAKGQARVVRKVQPKHRAVKRKSVVIPPAKEGQGRDARKVARRAEKREESAKLAAEVQAELVATQLAGLVAEEQERRDEISAHALSSDIERFGA